MASASATVVRADTVLSGRGPLSPGEVVLDRGVIVEVRPATGAEAGGVGHAILAPGFIDLQCNGIGTIDVAAAADRDWAVLDAALLAQGVTTWCPTLVSAPRADMEASLGRITEAAARPPQGRPAIAGAHLEGPFLAVPGAHRPADLLASVDRSWLGSLPPVAVVTLAPELPGAMAAIGQLAAAGVLVSLGHSACSVEQAGDAAGAGARLVTHLGNGMGPFAPRQPGLLGAALADDRLAVSLIADLEHVHRALLRMAFLAKGAAGTVLVTDSVAVAGGRTADGGPPRLADGTLVGSVLAMDRAVAHTVEDAAIALADAVAAASTTPARLLGLDDRGVIAPGRRADLVALDADLRVRTVWLAGAEAWCAPAGGSPSPPP
jgi:N-acetylglucosamine-6-phosphate deacetylase